MMVQGGRGDIHKVWHLIWRRERVCRSCCVETLRAQLLMPLWPTEVHTAPDYMSGLVSPAKQAPGCRRGLPAVASYTPPHAIRWTEFRFRPVRLGKITEDSKRLLVSVDTRKCCSAHERMRLVLFLFVLWLIESAWLEAELPSRVTCVEFFNISPFAHVKPPSRFFFLQILLLYLSQQPTACFNRLI